MEKVVELQCKMDTSQKQETNHSLKEIKEIKQFIYVQFLCGIGNRFKKFQKHGKNPSPLPIDSLDQLQRER